MNEIITTPRLKLTLVTSAPLGSPEFNWIHELRSNEQSSWWSLYGPSKTTQDTEKALQIVLAAPPSKDEAKTWGFAYAVHELQGSDSHFIGLITLRSLTDEEIKHPPYNTHASTATCLSLVLGYSYLPTSWGHGYATESVDAVLKACGDAPKTFWEPFEQVVVRAVVNDENGPSQRVMEKSGMEGPEVLEFEGGTFFIAGKWRTKHRLFVYKRVVVG